MHRHIIVGFGASPLKVTSDLTEPIPLRLGIPGWTGDINFTLLQRSLKSHGMQPSELGLDLFTIALGVYAADLCSSRPVFGDDGWTRHLIVEVEVSDPSVWENSFGEIAAGLRFLSNDVWSFCFTKRTRSVRQLGFHVSGASRFRSERLSLFSGGLDSTIGAIDQAVIPEPLILASTAGERSTSGPQSNIFPRIAAKAKGPVIHIRQHVQIPRHLRNSREDSQRSRSFMFLAFGLFIASGIDNPVELLLPENGFIALNVPVDSTRLGSNSTKTTHPYFVGRVRDFIARASLPVRIVEPYRFATKGEMLAQAADQLLLADVLPASVSCAKAAQLFRQSTNLLHCGACTACVIRRAAISKGWPAPDPTGYFFIPDLIGESIDAREHGQDIRALKAAAARIAGKPALAHVDVYRSGSLSDVRGDIAAYADVYRRGMLELNSLLEKTKTFHG